MARHVGHLRCLVRLYGLVVATMMRATTLMQWVHPMFVIASRLLLLSDLFFALQCLVLTKPAHKRAVGQAMWPACFMAQMMIATALAPSYGHFYILPKG